MQCIGGSTGDKPSRRSQAKYPRWHVAVNRRRQVRPAVSYRAEGQLA
jgi:hypothetical protein